MAVDGHIEAGQAALQAGRWGDARAAFEAALASERDAPEALNGMAEALWWLCDPRSSVRYRERAYLKFLQSGDTVLACRMALALSTSYLVNLGNEAASRGWLARAERVMEQTEANPMQGWLWLIHSIWAPEPGLSQELMRRALDFARDSGDVDLELVARANLGLALVVEGSAEAGMALLDEAMAGTLGGEYRRLDTVVYTSCNMLAACSLVGDLERATQWCRVADDFMQVYGCPFLYARCRAHYGSVLVAKGQWVRAEDELQAALHMSEDAGPGPRAEALAQLADLRFRQGRLEEAEALLADFGDVVTAALPAAAVRLARGEPVVAVGLLERNLNQLGERHIAAPPTLAMLVEAHIAAGDLAAATEAAERLSATARVHGRPHGVALAVLAAAHVSAARGNHDEAITQLERALAQFSRLDFPLETARVRLKLAGALVELRPELALAEARSALSALEQLGATADADAAASLLRSLGATGRTGPKRVGVLTKREQEVLRLVGLGLSNPEIAERLFISRKTAAHHVSHVLEKLGLRNRAEAVAYAAGTMPGRART